MKAEEDWKYPTYYVAAGIVERGNKVLGARRKTGNEYDGFWEFPGGKVEEGESYLDATQRELREELGVEVTDLKYFFTTSYPYPKFRLHMETYTCRVADAYESLDHFVLEAHDEVRWFAPEDLVDEEWLPASHEMLDLIRSKQARGK
jgi:8-oxo-dGTP diphosphatase